MKKNVFKVMSIFLFLGICLSAFKNEEFAKNTTIKSAQTDDPYMYLLNGVIDVTDGEIVFDGTTPVEPYIDALQVVVTNGFWEIEYGSSSAEAHIGLSNDHDTSDATVYIWPDGTPGTYELKFYLDDVLMATLTIIVQE
jgi:hypothetical protein